MNRFRSDKLSPHSIVARAARALCLFTPTQLGKVMLNSTLMLMLGTVLSLTISPVVAADNPAATASITIQAPPFDLPVIANGEGRISLADLKGKVVYIDFWASWCGPCRISLPALDQLTQTFSSEDFAIIAVSVDVVEEDALDFLLRYPVSYPVLIDTEGNVAKAFAVNGMPSGYLLDAAGSVHEVHVGFKRGDEVTIEASIRALLAQSETRE